MKRVVRISIVLLISLGVVLGVVKLRRSSHANNKASIANQNNLVVHEWGTFTSIAGKDGVALEWRPLNGSIDLPKFVHTMQLEDLGLRHSQSKAQLTALVVMDTPRVKLTLRRCRFAARTAKPPNRKSFCSIAALAVLTYRCRQS